jgi:hypothetical protein
MAKSSKKHGTTKKPSATKNAPLSPLEIAFLYYEAGDVVAARTQAKAFAPMAPETPPAPACVAKLWHPPLPSPLPSQRAVALSLLARTRPPPSAYAHALLGIAVALLLGLVVLLRS